MQVKEIETSRDISTYVSRECAVPILHKQMSCPVLDLKAKKQQLYLLCWLHFWGRCRFLRNRSIGHAWHILTFRTKAKAVLTLSFDPWANDFQKFIILYMYPILESLQVVTKSGFLKIGWEQVISLPSELYCTVRSFLLLEALMPKFQSYFSDDSQLF